MKTIRNLNGPVIDKDEKTQCLVIFLHGWGSNGDDLIQLGNYWESQIKNASFLAPNGPETCPGNPQGRQWFDIFNDNDEKVLDGINQAYIDLKGFIDEKIKYYKLKNNQYFLVGFSQGTMLALYTAIRENLLGVVGYSGAFLEKNPTPPFKKNDFILIHGENDSVVPINSMYKAAESLEDIANRIDTKSYKDLEHSINEEGLQEGLKFIQNRI